MKTSSNIRHRLDGAEQATRKAAANAAAMKYPDLLMTVERALELFTTVGDLVQANVSDPAVLGAIHRDLEAVARKYELEKEQATDRQ